MDKNIKVAIIGAGNMGEHRARSYSNAKNIDLVAVSDINEKKGKNLADKFGCCFFNNYNKMFSEKKIDIVVVSVPTKLHKKICLDVISNNKDLIVEKPFASNSKEAKEIVNAAENAGIKLSVSHIERFNPAIKKLKKDIQAGKFGKITSIIVRRVGIFPPHFISDSDVIMGLVIHDIDILNYLLDNKQPCSVFAKGAKIFADSGIDSAEIFLSYGDISVFIQANWITPGKFRKISITGTEAYAELNCLTQELEFYKVNPSRKINSFTEFIKYGQPVKKQIKIKKTEPMPFEIKFFMESIKYNKKIEVMGEDGLKSIIIAEKAKESLKFNKLIKI